MTNHKHLVTSQKYSDFCRLKEITEHQIDYTQYRPTNLPTIGTAEDECALYYSAIAIYGKKYRTPYITVSKYCK